MAGSSDDLKDDTREDIAEPGLDDNCLLAVANKLGCEWVELASELGFTLHEIVTIEENYRGRVIRQGWTMLVKWKRAQSTRLEQQITELCTSLKKKGREDIVTFLRGFPTMSVEIHMISKGTQTAPVTINLLMNLSDSSEEPNKIRRSLSHFLALYHGVLDLVISGSVICVVRMMSREGLNKFWSMYTTGELANKLTKILITEELTTEDKSDFAIQVAIPKSDYDKACTFFDELEEDQRKDKDPAERSDPAEHAEERLTEKMERLPTTTEGSSDMMKVEQLGGRSTSTTAYSSDPAEHAEERMEEKMERLPTTTGRYSVASICAGDWWEMTKILKLPGH
ncbi:uncharacterized protein LOC119735207 [Patiria miniata]|uniref:Death domain-containing protein n=1 Tax=Patiria miniata TaxID=46514 RepID=A0A914ALG7_PATMI|nr:uncharacterized protein LOC119735207 [Patiria miniata]